MSGTRDALWTAFAMLVVIAITGAQQALRPERTAESRRQMTDENPDRERLSAMPNWATYRAQREDPERIARSGKWRFMISTIAAIALLAYLMVQRP